MAVGWLPGSGWTVSPWVVLCFPAAILISFGFTAVGIATTTFMQLFDVGDRGGVLVPSRFLQDGHRFTDGLLAHDQEVHGVLDIRCRTDPDVGP
jgi:hypothetical protein